MFTPTLRWTRRFWPGWNSLNSVAAISTRQLHQFFRQISQAVPEAVLFGGAVEPTVLNQWAIIGVQARQTLVLNHRTLVWSGQEIELESPNQLFGILEQARLQARQWPKEKMQFDLPMAGGLAVCLGYEFYRWCDTGWWNSPSESVQAWPELRACEFEDWLFIHLKSGQLVVLSDTPEQELVYQGQWRKITSQPALERENASGGLNAEQMADYLQGFEVSFTPEAFELAVERVKQAIREGEVYQANLTMRLEKTIDLEPYTLFEQLCLDNPSPFAGFWKTPHSALVCNSPERLVKLDETGFAQTRPIAGTRGRGLTPEEDERIGQSLLANEKERAEHLMLVDLARNDLGRVCETGTVVVDELLVLERYSHVTHLVSNVSAQLNPKKTGWDLVQSLFPGGTITGCPKIRCVNILEQLEPVSRGLYTGSLGYMDAASGALDLNILIRSVYLKPTENPLRYNTAVHVGAGIVHNAVGTHEYRECLRKANAILNALYRLENSALNPV